MTGGLRTCVIVHSFPGAYLPAKAAVPPSPFV
jgi:hypothetical protein